MARLLVTGGGGFVGSNFTRMAVTRGYDVRVLDTLTYAGDRSNLWGPPQGTEDRVPQGGRLRREGGREGDEGM